MRLEHALVALTLLTCCSVVFFCQIIIENVSVPHEVGLVALCAVHKGETKEDLQEWIDYHALIGFDHFFLYDNNKSPTPRQVFASKNALKVTNTPILGSRVQNKAYTQCLRLLLAQTNFTHAAMWDIDEFLVLKKHSNVQGLIHDHLRSGSLAINRLTFGLNGQETHVNLPALLRFPCRLDTKFSKNKFVKSVGTLRDVDPSRAVGNPHRSFPLQAGCRMRDTRGNLLGQNHPDGVTQNGRQPYEVAALYHFYTKSREELIRKRRRGDAFFGNANRTIKDIEEASQGLIQGKMLPKDTVWDNRAWGVLQKDPKYRPLARSPLLPQVQANWTCQRPA